MRSFRRWAVPLWALTMAATACAVTSEDHIEQSIQQHKNWIRSCTDSSIAVSRPGLILYAVDLGPNGDDVIRCLLSSRDTNSESLISDSPAAITYPSPIDIGTLGDGPQRKIVEVLIRANAKAFIISGLQSDGGVSSVGRISRDAFIVAASYASHNRTYLFFGDSGTVKFLTDGDVNIVNEEIFVFLVKGRKSYLNDTGGAFWFDALIDRDGHILDIVTSREKQSSVDIECMSRDELIRRSSLELSRVSSHEICVER